ncbi:hypothetical protein [Rhodopirellula sp. MGV]|uniref:hypothetical protein n=1 Tax=Rhodopirellula sp. MGV TaxID=2023130 RepID=UPI000B95FB7F|nr:hypothetical protein [Rhodopirellula sp. MGV]OYP35442.1 hypothetical protein CGZ80_11390 [Rhodopirellula sp. MGV]
MASTKVPAARSVRCPWCDEVTAIEHWFSKLPPIAQVLDQDGNPLDAEPEADAISCETQETDSAPRAVRVCATPMFANSGLTSSDSVASDESLSPWVKKVERELDALCQESSVSDLDESLSQEAASESECAPESEPEPKVKRRRHDLEAIASIWDRKPPTSDADTAGVACEVEPAAESSPVAIAPPVQVEEPEVETEDELPVLDEFESFDTVDNDLEDHFVDFEDDCEEDLSPAGGDFGGIHAFSIGEDDRPYQRYSGWRKHRQNATRWLKIAAPSLLALPVLGIILMLAGLDLGLYPFDGSFKRTSLAPKHLAFPPSKPDPWLAKRRAESRGNAGAANLGEGRLSNESITSTDEVDSVEATEANSVASAPQSGSAAELSLGDPQEWNVSGAGTDRLTNTSSDAPSETQEKRATEEYAEDSQGLPEATLASTGESHDSNLESDMVAKSGAPAPELVIPESTSRLQQDASVTPSPEADRKAVDDPDAVVPASSINPSDADHEVGKVRQVSAETTLDDAASMPVSDDPVVVGCYQTLDRLHELAIADPTTREGKLAGLKAFRAVSRLVEIDGIANRDQLADVLTIIAGSEIRFQLETLCGAWVGWSKRQTDGILLIGHIESNETGEQFVLADDTRFAILAGQEQPVAHGQVVALAELQGSESESERQVRLICVLAVPSSAN